MLLIALLYLLLLALLQVDVMLDGVFLLLIRVMMDVCCKLINVASHEVFLNDFKLVFVLVVLLLLFDDQSVPVLQGVFCASIEVFYYLGPLL